MPKHNAKKNKLQTNRKYTRMQIKYNSKCCRKQKHKNKNKNKKANKIKNSKIMQKLITEQIKITRLHQKRIILNRWKTNKNNRGRLKLHKITKINKLSSYKLKSMIIGL